MQQWPQTTALDEAIAQIRWPRTARRSRPELRPDPANDGARDANGVSLRRGSGHRYAA